MNTHNLRNTKWGGSLLAFANTNGMKLKLLPIIVTLALSSASASANAEETDAVKWILEMGLDLVGGDIVRTNTLANGNTVNARANEGLILNMGGVTTIGANDRIDLQFTIGYKFDIASSDELVWYSVPLEVIQFYRINDNVRLGGGLSYHAYPKLAGRTTDHFDNALGWVARVGWIPMLDNRASGDLYSFDLRYTVINFQRSNAPNTAKINGNALGLYLNFRY